MTKIINLNQHLSANKHSDPSAIEPDEMVDRQVRKIMNAIHELLNAESFNTDDPAMMQHLVFLRRCLVAMVNHQYGINDPIAELMLQGNPKQL
jgi:hypothetical protein